MNTERTDITGEAAEGWVFYDGECPLCLGTAERFGPLLSRRGFQFAPLQAPWVQRRLHHDPNAPLAEMRLLLPDGRVFGGADALIAIARQVWCGWPLFLFAKIPGALHLLRAIYVQVAANRNCAGGKCAIRRRPLWWPLVLLPSMVFLFRNDLPAWVFMWLLTFAIFFGCKWLTWRSARGGTTPVAWKAIGYFVAWPGMDADAFLRTRSKGAVVNGGGLRAWAPGSAKLCVGALLVYVAARDLAGLGPFATGWFGLIGVILALHFGVGDLLALGWQRLGVDATPLMRSPIRATSLAEFWGRRWNTGFSRLAREFIFKPIARRWSARVAAFAVFLVSGLIHELVISVPARGGYGLPTAYFAIQGLGMLAERSRPGRWLRLGQGIRGWLFTMSVLIAPLCLLCPPIFIQNVILPMLRALGGR